MTLCAVTAFTDDPTKIMRFRRNAVDRSIGPAGVITKGIIGGGLCRAARTSTWLAEVRGAVTFRSSARDDVTQGREEAAERGKWKEPEVLTVVSDDDSG